MDKRWLLSVVLIGAALGCGGGAFEQAGQGDPGQDAGQDSVEPDSQDTPETSVEPDGDVGQDVVQEEAGEDATDAGTGTEVGSDAGEDAPVEAATGEDAPVEADAAGDDAQEDAAPDSPEADAVGDDAAPDAPITCTEGDKRCNGNVVESCESDGEWHVHTYCPGLQHAGNSTCNAGTCVPGCDLGWSDCNGSPTDGCEMATSSDVLNCGSCGHACNGPACYSGTCAQEVDEVAAPAGHVLAALAQDATHLYWMEDTSGMGIAWNLRRVPKTGGAIDTLVVDASHGQGMDLVVAGGYAWWTEPYGGGIWKVPVGGGLPVVVVDPVLLGNTSRAKTDRILVDTARGRLLWFGKDSLKNLNSVPTAGGGVSLVASIPYVATDYTLDDGGNVYAVCDTGTDTRLWFIRPSDGLNDDATGYPIQGRPTALYARFSVHDLFFATTASTDHVQCVGGYTGCPDWSFTSTSKPLDTGFGKYRLFDVDTSYYRTNQTRTAIERQGRTTITTPRTEASGQDRVKELTHDDSWIYWINDHGDGTTGEIRRAPNLAP